jgi:biotin carboxylase
LRTILVLGATHNQAPLITAARIDGLRVVAIDPNPDAVGFKDSDKTYVYDLGDIASCLRIAQQENIHAVLTIAADYPVRTVAKICESMGLVGLSTLTATISTDKLLFAQTLTHYGVRTPVTVPVHSVTDCLTFLELQQRPVVIKPNRGSGGRGIVHLRWPTKSGDVDQAFQHALNHSADKRVIAQEFIDGPEYSVESLTCDGRTHVISITEKSTSGEPYHVEIGHSQPAILKTDTYEEIKRECLRILKAMQLDNAASHIELKLSSTGPVVIEAAARMGGGFIGSHLVQYSTGINFLSETLAVALGEKIINIDTKRVHTRGAAIHFLVPKPGRVSKVTDLGIAASLPGVSEIRLYNTPPVDASPLKNNGDRVGHIITTGASAQQAKIWAEAASRTIQFIYEG